MKLINTNQEEPKFKPFQLTLEIESEDEARLLWHVFNRCNLRKIIFENYGSKYTLPDLTEFASTSTGFMIREYIESKVQI